MTAASLLICVSDNIQVQRIMLPRMIELIE